MATDGEDEEQEFVKPRKRARKAKESETDYFAGKLVIVRYADPNSPFYLARVNTFFEKEEEIEISWYDVEQRPRYPNGPWYVSRARLGSEDELVQRVSTSCVIVRHAGITSKDCMLTRRTMHEIGDMKAETGYAYSPATKRLIPVTVVPKSSK